MRSRLFLCCAGLLALTATSHAFFGASIKGYAGLYFKSGYYHFSSGDSPSATFYQFSLASGHMNVIKDLLALEWGILNFSQINGTAASPLDEFDRAIDPHKEGTYIKYPSMSLLVHLLELAYFGIDYGYNMRMYRNTGGGVDVFQNKVSVAGGDFGNDKTSFRSWVFGICLPMSDALDLRLEGMHTAEIKMYSITDATEVEIGGWGINFSLVLTEK